jgi:hypothetical protein
MFHCSGSYRLKSDIEQSVPFTVHHVQVVKSRRIRQTWEKQNTQNFLLQTA